MKRVIKSRKIFALLIYIILAVLLSGHTVVAGVRVFSDNRLKSGGDIFWTEGLEEFDIFKDLRPPMGGDAIIEPGSEGTYSFVVENRGDVTLDVYFRLFDENAYQIPMAYRLKTGEQYLIGNHTTWEDCDSLDKYEVKDTLSGHTRREYQLDWCWMEGKDADGNALDTWIGNQAAEGANVTYTLSMSLLAEEVLDEPSEPSKPTDPSEPSEPTNPSEPSEPTEPTDPTGPSEPTEPTNPTEPSEPTDPTDPDGNGMNHSQDSDTEQNPSENAQDSDDVQQVVVLPQTGDDTSLWIYLGAAVIAGAVLFILLWKKKTEEEEGAE